MNDGRASPPFLGADLDALHTPPDRGRSQRARQFGVRARHYDAHGLHDVSERGIDHGMTPQFRRVAGESARRQRPLVQPVGEFNFGDDANMRHEAQQQQQSLSNAHRLASNSSSKYRPRASGKLITPGASLKYSGEAHLEKAYLPPKEAGAFVSGIMNVSDRAKEKRPMPPPSSVATSPHRPMRMRASTSALEVVSAPSPSRATRSAAADDAKAPPMLMWQPSKRAERQAQPLSLTSSVLTQRPRIALTPGKRALDAIQSPPRLHTARAPVTRQSTLPRRNRDVLRSLDTPTLRRATTRARTAQQTDGTADQPIDLDTDSDHETPPPAKRLVLTTSPRRSTAARTTATSQSIARANVPRLKPPHWKDVDVDAIKREPVAELLDTVVWIGRVRCCADVYLRRDCLWLCAIRSTMIQWDYMDHLKFGLADCKSVHVYRYDDARAPIPDADHTADERLLAKSSFTALCVPCAYAADSEVLRPFYDPLGADAAKQFVVIQAPDYDSHGQCFDLFETHVVDHYPELLHMVVDVAEGKQCLQALVAEPYDGSAATSADADARGDDAPADDDSDSECYDVLLTYPLPPCSSDIVTITRADVSRLRPEQYLNDNIIDYYFKRVMLEDYATNAFVQRNVLFLSSHFFSRLRAGKGASVAERLRAGYRNVATWVARTDFFSRHIIFIPINKDMHWSLAVILNPRSAAVESPPEDQPPSCIAVLDPLGGYHNKQMIARHLRSFLQLEWESAHSATDATADPTADPPVPADTQAAATALTTQRRRPPPRESPHYNADRVALVTVKAPRQQNSYDCGVYVLQFAEVILAQYMAMRAMFDDSGPVTKDIVDDKLEALLPARCIAPDDIVAARLRLQESIKSDTAAFHRAVAAARADEQQREAEAKAIAAVTGDDETADHVDAKVGEEVMPTELHHEAEAAEASETSTLELSDKETETDERMQRGVPEVMEWDV